MGTSLNTKNDKTCQLASELARLPGRKDTTMTKPLISTLMLVILLLANTSLALGGDLHIAAGKGDTAAVKALLAAGVGVNAKDKDGRTALYLAAEKGHTKTVDALLAGGGRYRD